MINNIPAMLFIKQRDRFSFGGRFRVKNVESIHHWHSKKAFSFKLVPSKTQKLSPKVSNHGGSLGDTIFIQCSRKWIAKFWQVRSSLLENPLPSNIDKPKKSYDFLTRLMTNTGWPVAHLGKNLAEDTQHYGSTIKGLGSYWASYWSYQSIYVNIRRVLVAACYFNLQI